MLKKIKLIGNSDVILSSNEMRELSGGSYGCGCCMCTPAYSATGAGTTTAQISAPPTMPPTSPTPRPSVTTINPVIPTTTM